MHISHMCKEFEVSSIKFHPCLIFTSMSGHLPWICICVADVKVQMRMQIQMQGEWAFLRATSHMKLNAVTNTLQAFSLVEKVGPVQVHFMLRLRDQRSMWMQDGCEVYMDSYMASNGSCFTVTWTIFKNHLLEVRLAQNRVTMALQMLTPVELLYFIMCEDPHE